MLLTTLALAASLQFDCPATIETRQQLLTPQQGWQAFTRDDDGKPGETLSHRLDNLALFDGDPAELAQLKPDNGDNDEIDYWSQLDSSRAPSIWSAAIRTVLSPCSRRCPSASVTAASTSATATPCSGWFAANSGRNPLPYIAIH